MASAGCCRILQVDLRCRQASIQQIRIQLTEFAGNVGSDVENPDQRKHFE